MHSSFVLRRTGATTALVAALLVGCGGPPPVPAPAPPPGSSSRNCPPSVSRSDDSGLPRRVRVENATAGALEVWIDRCFWYSYLGEIGPGEVIVPELPTRLVRFAEGLRFQAFDDSARAHAGTYVLPLDDDDAAGPLPVLVLSDSTVRDRGALQAYFFDERSAASAGTAPVINSADDDGSYTAVFAERSGAILSWSCTDDGERHLVLSTAGPLAGETVRVRSRVGLDTDGGDFREEGSWRVQKGFTDAAVAPSDVAERLTREALEAGRVELVIDEETGSMQGHGFETEGVAEALAEGCWAAGADTTGR